MVLGITLRRKKKVETTPPVSVRPNPSLPDITAGDLQWPSAFIDDTAGGTASQPDGDVLQSVGSTTGSPSREPIRQRGAINISFHRPFRKDSFLSERQAEANHTKRDNAKGPRPSIASMYASQPIKLFSPAPPIPSQLSTSRPSQRNKRRVPHIIPTFNLMIAGGSATGKTSLARLLLETCQVSPVCPPAQREAVESFMKDTVRSTATIESATIEIDEGPERIAFTVLDTPGLLLSNELDMERSVTSIVRHLDARFAETLEEVR